MITKPFLKWVGGKTQIIEKLMNHIPKDINNYHEIFLGGGSVLLSVLCLLREGKINIKGKVYAYDINEPLIRVYKNIQTDHTMVYKLTQELITQERLIDKEEYYYKIRNDYNNLLDKKSFMGSAMFIYLNKTCFRGIFRIGPHGFNVPYGNYKNPEIINKQHLEQVSQLIQDVVFEACDFTVSLSKTQDGDFVYLDPPYVPEKKNSFVKYTENGFNEEQHTKLFGILIKTHIYWVMSNSDTPLVREKFNIFSTSSFIQVDSYRRINSKKPESKTKELIIIHPCI